ncbi:ssDNA-binding domain-containing protein [Tenacibaculum dicentrarchi]|nr:ssDNA-binding domain-containing protein [Tenacibaculum dicentrarchi]MCD8420840.1 ssDNA-binding domain-containing protein [Tenacibaculum dicentrarchi]
MTIQQQFKNLNGSTVSRSQLEVIIANAKKANDTEIIYRLSGILLANKGVNKFDVSLRNYPTALAGSRHKGAYKEALTECGRLRKGWRFSKGGVFKVATLDKKTKQFKMGLSGCGCGAPKNTCGCKKKSLNANNLSFDELEGLGLPFVPNPESVEDPTALGKPFTNDDIYQMITDKMISLVEKSTGTGYKRKWGQKEFYEKDGFLIPINFVSKNAYRGVNPWLLKDDFLDVMDNPYFMTFKQIKEKKGKLKKGSKGKPIVYFTLLYKFDNPKTKKEFGTYDKEYMIKYIKNFGHQAKDFDDVVYSIPILKYYNVFNGSDIEDIDFKLDELKLGRVVKSDESLANEKNEAAELIVANYPKIAPTIKHGGDNAYYNSATDGVQMPRFQSFETPNDYYRTLLHELIHSTGNEKRLARKFGKKFGSKDYAFEELVAEFGSVFLSANAGIIWHSNKNHEEYLANWNNSLKIAKDDNKFLMRAASAAQKASDFVLNLDANNVPAFYKELGKITVPKKTVKETSTKKTTSIPDSSAYPVAVPETKITIKANAPFDSCGRLRKGWKFQNGKPVQVIPKKKATKRLKTIVKQRCKDVDRKKAISLALKRLEAKSRIPISYNIPSVISNYEADLFIKAISTKGNEVTAYFWLQWWFDYKNEPLFDIPDDLRKKMTESAEKNSLRILAELKKTTTPRPTKTTKTAVKPTPIKLGNPKNPENPKNPKKTNSLAYKMANRQNKVSEIYKIKDENISEFLGEIEVKQKESVVITLTGGQGSMKTRCAFRFMNAFAQKYKVGHASIEEHPESTLYYNKVDEYINDTALNNIHNPEINSISDLDMLVKENDIIVIDSFAKMQEIQKGFEVDKDLRKKYDGKLFIVIFQQTTDGKMRGGSKSQFDADIILFTEKFDNYQDNYIYADKNRYQNKNLTDLKYNIFEGKLNALEVSVV